MLGHMIATATKVAMQNHTYTYRGSTYHQGDGGPIGNPLSSAVARAVMLDWDSKFLGHTTILGTAVNRNLCRIYKRYVDDQFGKHQPTPPGWRWDPVGHTPVHSQQALHEDRGKEDDERTMTLLQNVANSINPRIQMTVDFPSANADNKMPVLDFKCWVDDEGTVMYEFYRKSMCPQSTIYAESALSWRTKRTVHTQEGVRILSRCHESLPWTTKAGHLTRLSASMAASGYPAQFRADVITSALKAFLKIKERADSGVRPVHRPDNLDKERRTQDKVWKSQDLV